VCMRSAGSACCDLRGAPQAQASQWRRTRRPRRQTPWRTSRWAMRAPWRARTPPTGTPCTGPPPGGHGQGGPAACALTKHLIAKLGKSCAGGAWGYVQEAGREFLAPLGAWLLLAHALRPARAHRYEQRLTQVSQLELWAATLAVRLWVLH